MGNMKQVNIKNETYYFFDSIININDFYPNLLKYIKEKNGSKYLVFDSVNENNEVLRKYNEL